MTESIFSFADDYFYTLGDTTHLKIINTTHHTFSSEYTGVTVDGITSSPDGQYIYYGRYYHASLERRDLVSGEEHTIGLGAINVGGNVKEIYTRRIISSPDGRYLYVTSNSAPLLTVVSTEKGERIKFIRLESLPNFIDIAPNGKFIYLTRGENIQIVDAITLEYLSTVTVPGANLQSMVFVDNTTLWIADYATNQIVVMDLTDPRVPVPGTPISLAGTGPTTLAITPDKKFVYVLNRDSSNVSVVDTTGGQELTGTGYPIAGITDGRCIKVTADGKLVYIGGNSGAYAISTITNTLLVNPVFPIDMGANIQDDAAVSYSVPVVTVVPHETRSLVNSDFYNTVTWTKPVYASLDHYKICRDNELTNCLGTVGAGAEMKIEDHKLLNGKTYTYYVVAESPWGILSIGKKTVTFQL